MSPTRGPYTRTRASRRVRDHGRSPRPTARPGAWSTGMLPGGPTPSSPGAWLGRTGSGRPTAPPAAASRWTRDPPAKSTCVRVRLGVNRAVAAGVAVVALNTLFRITSHVTYRGFTEIGRRPPLAPLPHPESRLSSGFPPSSERRQCPFLQKNANPDGDRAPRSSARS